jgi:hypothetical protein
MAVATAHSSIEDKENRPPKSHDEADLVAPLRTLTIRSKDEISSLHDAEVAEDVVEDPAVLAERAHHLRFIEQALDMVRSPRPISRTRPFTRDMAH